MTHTYYVLEIPTEGLVPGEKPLVQVRGTHASRKVAEGQASALQTDLSALCCYRYQAMARTEAEKRYTLTA